LKLTRNRIRSSNVRNVLERAGSRLYLKVKLQTAVYWIKPPGKGKNYSIRPKAWLRKERRGGKTWEAEQRAEMMERSSCLETETDRHDGQNLDTAYAQ
jgi:hypothetical protein